MVMDDLIKQLRSVFSEQKRPAYERRRPVRHILFLTIPTGLFFSILSYLDGKHGLALVELVIMLGVLPPVCWVIRHDRYIGVGETLVMLAAVALFSALLVTGGRSGAGSSWIFVYPFLAFYINDQRRAWLWVGFFALAVLAYAEAVENGLASSYYSPEQLDIFALAFLVFSGMAYIFNSVRNQYDSRLETQVEEQTRELRRSLEELRHRALHDDLTGLPNRYLLEDRLAQTLKACEREGYCTFCVVVANLDRFQEINNVLGHDGGDEVLKQLAGRISELLRASDTVARVGGDTFAMILPKADGEAAHTVAQKIFLAMDEPFVVHGTEVEMSVSIGIAMAPVHGSRPDVLLQRADLAMRQAKVLQTGTAVVYDQEQDPYSLRRLMLFGKLRKAITNGQLTLVYQPKIDLVSLRIDSVEALIRWYDEEEGQIPLGEFIPMAEQTGMINPMSEWVLEEAASQAVVWKQAGFRIPIAVNLSPRNLLNPTLVPNMEALLTRHDLSGDEICIEVTESALITQPKTALSILSALSEMGIAISIDDFGTGYSSLAYLKHLPVDELKIDRCFVSAMLTSEADRMIVKSTVELAHGLDLSVVAEGVEEKEVLMALKEMGVDKAQGFYMSRPLSPADLETWLAESEWGLSAARPRAATQTG